MDWKGRRPSNMGRGYPAVGSVNPTATGYSAYGGAYGGYYRPLLPPSSLSKPEITKAADTPEVPSAIDERYSYYLSLHPLYCADWSALPEFDTECVAVSSYKEGFLNKLHILHGIRYGKEATIDDDSMEMGHDETIEGFDLYKVAEVGVDYPITNLQWDPYMTKIGNGYNERLATSGEVLRLYKVDHENLEQNNDYKLLQTHYLTNTTTNSSGAAKSLDIMTCPPVTSFDWNKIDNSIIITSSVDTTCTVWDLNRPVNTEKGDSACVKTQLIAHDLEVFDVKFLHDSTNVFASVGNDGSMRVFDLRSLEHSTIIYEPSGSSPSKNSYNSKALLKLATSNVDQNYLATIGVNSNQIIVVDNRMPGVPVTVLDGSFGGVTQAAINLIQWHPNSNFLLSGGDDCQALVWDCNNVRSHEINTPVLAYSEDLEINNACWRAGSGDWMGVVSGKGFQAVLV